MAIVFSMIGGSGCTKTNQSATISEHHSAISTDISVNTPTPTDTPTPTPTPDPATLIKNEALALAEEVGMPEEALREKYEFFLEYMDCVKNNPNLNGYRGYAAQIFPVVADHLKDENKDLFLGKLRELVMETQQLSSTQAGVCYQDDCYIKVSDSEMAQSENYCIATIFHELMHFVDYYIDGEHMDEVVYVGDKYIRYEDMTDEDWNNMADMLVAHFIIEGGAELYSAKYFIRSTLSYKAIVNFLTGLEMIFGSDVVGSLFFSGESTMEFVKLMQASGFTNEEINKAVLTLNYYTYPERFDKPYKPLFPEEILIRLYRNRKGDTWKEDKEFCHVLACVRSNYERTEESEFDDFLETLKIDYTGWEDWKTELLEQIDPSIYAVFWSHTTDGIYLDGNFCISARIYTDKDDNDYYQQTLTFDYDFEKEKVNSYVISELPCPKKIPDPVPSGAELDKRLDSFEHDHAPMHAQKVQEGAFSDLHDLYAHATEIGNKYGVTIRICDLVPDDYKWIQRETYGSEERKNIQNCLNKIDETLAQFPEGYFDQLNYGYWRGLVISLIDNDNIEYYTRKSFYDGEYHMGVFLTGTEKGLETLEEELIKSVFYYTEMRLRLISENMQEPYFSDITWRETYNPMYFRYRGENTEQWIQPYYDEYKDYVVSKEAMETDYSDRFCLMTYLMKAASDPEAKVITQPCVDKAEYYCDCIRKCFDTSGWPETLPWEKALADMKAKLSLEEEESA